MMFSWLTTIPWALDPTDHPNWADDAFDRITLTRPSNYPPGLPPSRGNGLVWSSIPIGQHAPRPTHEPIGRHGLRKIA